MMTSAVDIQSPSESCVRSLCDAYYEIERRQREEQERAVSLRWDQYRSLDAASVRVGSAVRDVLESRGLNPSHVAGHFARMAPSGAPKCDEYLAARAFEPDGQFAGLLFFPVQGGDPHPIPWGGPRPISDRLADRLLLVDGPGIRLLRGDPEIVSEARGILVVQGFLPFIEAGFWSTRDCCRMPVIGAASATGIAVLNEVRWPGSVDAYVYEGWVRSFDEMRQAIPPWVRVRRIAGGT